MLNIEQDKAINTTVHATTTGKTTALKILILWPLPERPVATLAEALKLKSKLPLACEQAML